MNKETHGGIVVHKPFYPKKTRTETLKPMKNDTHFSGMKQQTGDVQCGNDGD